MSLYGNHPEDRHFGRLLDRHLDESDARAKEDEAMAAADEEYDRRRDDKLMRD